MYMWVMNADTGKYLWGLAEEERDGMKHARTKHQDFIVGDIAALGLAQFLMVIIHQDRLAPVLYIYYVQLGILLIISTLTIVFLTDGYKDIINRGYLKEMIAVCHQMTLTFVVEILCLFTFQMSNLFSRLVLFATFFVGILFVYVERLLIKRILKRRFGKIKHARTIMVIAARKQAELLIERLTAADCSIFNIQGVAVTDCDMRGETIGGLTVNCSLDGVEEYIASHIIDEVLLCITGDPDREDALIRQFLSIDIVVHVYMDQFLQNIPGKTWDRLSGMEVLTCYNREIPTKLLLGKRLLDIAGGTVGVILAVLVAIIIGPIIYLKSPGPILFSQIRVGKYGRTFRLYKFRSMIINAEQQKKELLSRNKIQGNMFKIDDDPRIIPGIGHFIRKTSLDEFPQFFNVLKGDMSLVGTRPPTVDEYETYNFAHKKRLAMKPGITGLWQISGRSDITDFEDVIKLDEQYINQWNLEMDIKIIFKTILVIMNRKGSV